MLIHKNYVYDIANGKLTNVIEVIKNKIVQSENPLEHWNDVENLEGKTVLDLGCGWINSGHASTPEYFISRGASKIVGVDISCEEIQKLNELYPSHTFICKAINSPEDFSTLIEEHRPQVIKMDIEGAEVHLGNVPNEVFSSVEEFAIEYHNPECKKVVMEKFEELGFKITAINNFGYFCTDSNIMGIIHSKRK